MSDMTNQEFDNSNDGNILAALSTLVIAATWDETHAIFMETYTMLTTNRAFVVLCNIIDMHRQAGEIAEVENWNQYLQLLEETVRFGPHKAWHRFSDLQNQSAEAVELFIGAGTQEEKQDILVAQKKFLLSNPAFVYLRSKIEQERAAKDEEFVEYLMPHLQILERVRAHGIAVFAEWKSVK